MLCPEVVNFKAPESHFKISKPAKREDVLKENVRFDFNHSVCAVLPDVLNVPNSIISKLVDDSEYYKIFNLVPSRLLDVEFISGFVLHGKLSLLTVGRRIDCDDCLAVTSEGLLILNLRKETYQRLGLEGKVSHFYAKNKERYVVKIDLTDTTNLHPEKPFYKRAKRCLENLNPFTAIVTWRPPTPDICPSSIAKYFSDLKFKITECTSTLDSHTVYSTKVPAIDFDNVEPDDVEDVVEWLGMVAVDADVNMQGGPGNYVNSYVTPEPNYEVGQVKVLKFRGFFVREKVEEFVKEVLMISGIVKIDLTDTTNLHPEKPFYKRAKRCLDNLNPFTAIITWRPPSPDICPSSIAKYFSDLKFKVSECAPTLNSDTVYSTKVPAIDFDIVEPDDVEDVVEWLGMVAVDADLNMQGGPGNYVSSYVTPEPNYEVGQVKVLKFRGFFVREKVEEFVKEVLMISGRKFVAVFVQGFSDSPVSWCGKENHFYTSVDNGCLFIFDKEKGVFCEHSVSQKRYK